MSSENTEQSMAQAGAGAGSMTDNGGGSLSAVHDDVATLQEESTGSGEEILSGEKPSKKKKTPRTPEQKRKFWRRVRWAVILLILLAAGYYFYNQMQKQKDQPTPVETTKVETGNIEQKVSLNGKVDADETKTYFAPVTADITGVSAKVGDEVKKGQKLVTFGTKDMNRQLTQDSLTIKQAQGQYDDATYTDKEELAKWGIPEKASIDDVTDQIDDMVTERQNQINDKKERISQTLKDVNRVANDVNEDGKDDAQQQDLDHDSSYQEKATEIAKAREDTQYALEHDEEILKWQRQIEELNRLKQELTTAKSGMMTPGGRVAADATNQLAGLSAKNTAADIAIARKGITSEFNGVVTDVKAMSGMKATTGMELLTVAGTDQVKVTVSLTKYDLEKVKVGQEAKIKVADKTYEGKVVKIDRNATTNQQGGTVVSADIAIANPDQNLYIGLEATADVHTASGTDVLLVPIEAVNMDKKGSFVYVLEKGVVKRRNVKTGISSDTQQEIVSGLKKGDLILSGSTGDVKEGMKAVPMDQTGNGAQGGESGTGASEIKVG